MLHFMKQLLFQPLYTMYGVFRSYSTRWSKCHCCLGWWVQGRRKSPPEWVLAPLRLLCERPTSGTASRHNWDCWWTSWPLSCSTTQTSHMQQRPLAQAGVCGHNKYVPSQISTEIYRRSDDGRGRWIRPPARRWRRSTEAPEPPSVSQPLSSAHNAATTRRGPLGTGPTNEGYVDPPPRHGARGYLAARPAARRYAHGPALQAPPPGGVSTAGGAHIVQLQRRTHSSH